MSQSEVREVERGEVKKPKRRFDQRDFDHIAEYICDEHDSRKQKRRHLEKQWKEIDRQLRMEPEVDFKKLPTGEIDPGKAWMSEMELPLQAQALEVLTADARRMLFPDSGSWFRAHAALTDEYLDGVDFTSLVTGDENEVPSQINQDNADKLVEGFLLHLHRQYDFAGHYDHINAEAFKYGTGIGRGRMVSKPVLIHTAKGVVSEKKRIPILFPRSIKNTYLDDAPHNVMNEGYILGSSIIQCKSQGLEDLTLAANKGSTEPENEDGGWMPDKLKGMEGDKNGSVEVLEYEGDLIVPRKTVRSIVIPGAIVTVVKGQKDGKGKATVVRFRFRKDPFSSYLIHPYHVEDLESAYAVGPLMKGRPVQLAATAALNRLMDSAALKNAPPVGYNKDDQTFGQSGGPQIAPYALWSTIDPVTVHDNVGGDPTAMLQVYVGLLAQFENLSGVNAPRLGAQTVSHTTAFAKEAELSRGTVRTVDYVRSIGHGPLTRWLYMEYTMGRRALKGQETVYIDAYKGFVNLTKDALPDLCAFEWFGSAGPAEEQQKVAQRLQAAQLALGIDTQNVQLGGQPIIDRPRLIEEVLREGGWIDTDAIVRAETVSQGGAAASPLAVDSSGGGAAAASTLAAIAQGQGS